MPKPWFVYLIECEDGSIYTGIAVDVSARYQAHLMGTGAKYTRAPPRVACWPPLPIRTGPAHPGRNTPSSNFPHRKSDNWPPPLLAACKLPA